MPDLNPSVRELLALFEAELAQVKFPGVDAAALQAAVAELAEADIAVAGAEAALDAARSDRADREEALLGLAQRALAYAKVFAEESPELAAKLAALALPRSRKSGAATVEPAPRRRGRPRKVDASAPLFAPADDVEPRVG